MNTPPADAMQEQEVAIREFTTLLHSISHDGGFKRAAGEKPHWSVDPSHEAAIFSHLSKWKNGHLLDDCTGAHPLIHLAWRALAIAWIETHMLGQMTHREVPNGMVVSSH